MGRSLKNTLYNMGLTSAFEKAYKELGVKIDSIYDEEPDAGLGNGGLGRLAACFLDGLASQSIPAYGYSILYEYGIFRQKLVEGRQTELPDNWLPGGEVWLMPRESSAVDVCFEGTLKESWDNHYHHVEIENGNVIQAVPYDMFVAGKDGKGISCLRLWSARAPEFDMKSFNQGDFMRSMERQAMAEVISKVLYPMDNHPEGKSLRLRQQYFLVSASVQDIVRHHLREYGTIDNLPEKIAIHINDTHPTMAIPELMRILLDECGYGWDDAWRIVTNTVAYTNHTVMSEALECWSEDLVRRLIPRIYNIIKEIDNRFRAYVWESTHDADYVERTAIISGGAVGIFTGPYIDMFCDWIGVQIGNATTLQPVLMGIIVSVIMGLALTAPISSAAIAAVVFTSDAFANGGPGVALAAGAATVGCCCQMVGFAVSSWRENGFSGFLAQGLGTSMLQVPNIMRRPLILLPPTIASAILGPIATTLLVIENGVGVYAGMGTCGLVGPIGVIDATEPGVMMWVGLVLVCIVLPGVLAFIFNEIMRKLGWIKTGDMQLDL